MRAHVDAYGCALSFGEARELEDTLAGLGWDLSDSPASSDRNVLVTCVVVQKTERAMLKRIAAMSSGPKLIVTGCLATAGRERARPDIVNVTRFSPRPGTTPPEPATFVPRRVAKERSGAMGKVRFRVSSETLPLGIYHDADVVHARTTYLVGRRCGG